MRLRSGIRPRNQSDAMRPEYIAYTAMEPVSTVLFSLYRGTPSREDWLLACLQGAWPGLLGEAVANACRPAQLKGRELTIDVADAAWLPALAGMKAEFLKRIREAAGHEIQELTFVCNGVN